MRAREPDVTGSVERDGVRVGYDGYDGYGGYGGYGKDLDDPAGPPWVVLFTSWAITHMRQWKLQVPYLAQWFRVATVEVRGNGRADRPDRVEAYTDEQAVDDVLAVMDRLGIERAVLVGLSMGAWHALQFAARYPERSAGVVAFGASPPSREPVGFDVPRERYEGWGKFNRHHWLADYPDFARFFVDQVFSEPHSMKQREDGVAWALETDGPTLALTQDGWARSTPAADEETCRRVRCPVLVVHGDADAVVPLEVGQTVARWTGGSLLTVRGAGHAVPAREPVLTNRLIRDFTRRCLPMPPATATWTRAGTRRRRILYVSSPIGLGHVHRDLAIADALRQEHPDVEITWLTQPPVTRVLRDRGERVHPASASLASESAHIEAESGEHDLHAFQAARRMDEIMVANFMVFADLVDREPFDLWIADEGWDVDAFLHDNPELKRTAYVWLTDFTGWLPMPDGGADEERLAADWNEERIERGRRYPRLRDRSVFIGSEDDVVDLPLGPGLPTARDWARERYSFTGYVLPAASPLDRDELRAELGYRPDEQVVVVTVGGSGVGGPLLHRVAESFPFAEKLVPGLRMVLVTGPRIDPGSVSAPPGVEVRGYLPDLRRHLEACDLAVVQGGLSTTMELTAARRPFVYLPLRHHFEQQIHVPHRLANYRAGRRMDYAETTDPERLAEVIGTEIGRRVDYRPVETDGAARAARMLADLL